MKTAIGLAIIYYGFQLLGLGVAILFAAIYALVCHLPMESLKEIAIAPSLLLSTIFMGIYLWRAGFISKEKSGWSLVSIRFLLLTLVLHSSAILLTDFMISILPEIPDIMKQTFDVLQSGWVGILCIALIGPILEEFLFRGAITKILLRKYSPAKAIIFSALIFGLFHINPAQVLSATLFGLLFGWIYYKSASLIPCILMHVFNNSLSVYLSMAYPDAETSQSLFPSPTIYHIVIAASVVLFIVAFMLMRRTTVPYEWKQEANTN